MSDIYFIVREDVFLEMQEKKKESDTEKERERESSASDAIARREGGREGRGERERADCTMHPPLKQFERRRTQPHLVYAK